MKKLVIALAALTLAATSCEEFEPVFTLKYEEPAPFVGATDAQALAKFGVAEFTSIKDLKALYKSHGKPVKIEQPLVIRGQVTTSDESGNVYRELYLQDETGAIDFKIGRSSSYDDYKQGQILYINCNGFTLGEYGYKSGNYYGAGLIQLGLERGQKLDNNGNWVNADEYEVSYVDFQPILDAHVLKGAILPENERIQPLTTLTGEQIKGIKDDLQNKFVSQLVTLKDVKYGNQYGGKEVFALFYPDPNQAHTSNEPWNRVFLSSPLNNTTAEDYTYGVTTWALTKHRFTVHVASGAWDSLEVGSGGNMYGAIGRKNEKGEYDNKTDPNKFGYERLYIDVILEFAGAQSVSQYFMYDGVEVQIRTSGYARFADFEIPADVRDGSKTLDITGILSRYQGSAQFTLLTATYHGQTKNLLSLGDE